jgi:hypothetical protein
MRAAFFLLLLCCCSLGLLVVEIAVVLMPVLVLLLMLVMLPVPSATALSAGFLPAALSAFRADDALNRANNCLGFLTITDDLNDDRRR